MGGFLKRWFAGRMPWPRSAATHDDRDSQGVMTDRSAGRPVGRRQGGAALVVAAVLAALAATPAVRSPAAAQNVVIVMIDGARYDETFAQGPRYIPRIWNDLRPKGTLFRNFRADGPTLTNPGHAAILTGHYDNIDNDGRERPPRPTLFELLRASTGAGDTCCIIIAGKPKLHALTYGTDLRYGERFRGLGVGVPTQTDTAVWRTVNAVLDSTRPRLLLVNFPSVDIEGHDNRWEGYLRALRQADSLVYLLWQRLEADSTYRGKTTMFITSDHGRHDEEHGGFRNHGCSCEGCRRIIGLGIGPGFRAGAVVEDPLGQVDLAEAVALLFDLPFPERRGKKLLTGGK